MEAARSVKLGPAGHRGAFAAAGVLFWVAAAASGIYDLGFTNDDWGVNAKTQRGLIRKAGRQELNNKGAKARRRHE